MPSSLRCQSSGLMPSFLLSPFLFSTSHSPRPPLPPPIQQRLFTGGIFSEEVNEQLIFFARRHQLTSRVWVPVRCFDTILKPYGVTLRPAAALLAVSSTERGGRDGGFGRKLLSFDRKENKGREHSRYGEAGFTYSGRGRSSPSPHMISHSIYLSSPFFSSSTPSLQHNVLVNAEHTSHCCFLEQFELYATADAIGRRRGGSAGRGMEGPGVNPISPLLELAGYQKGGRSCGQSHTPAGSTWRLRYPSLGHSGSFFNAVPPQALQCCDHPLTVEGDPLMHLPTVQLMKHWKQRCGFTSPYWTREPPPSYTQKVREKVGVSPAITPAMNIGGWYPIETHPLCGQLNPTWCMSYTPHTLTNQRFPFLIERLMRERAAHYGYVSRLWLTPEEAWRVFQVTLRPEEEGHQEKKKTGAKEKGVEDVTGGHPAESRTDYRFTQHDPPIWCHHFSGGLQQDVYYCADQYALTSSQIPRGRETNMAACGVDIGHTKLKPFPLFASLFGSTPSSATSSSRVPPKSFFPVSSSTRTENLNSCIPVGDGRKCIEESKSNSRSLYVVNSAARQERLAALREKYREVRLFDLGASMQGNASHGWWMLELEAQLSRERFLRGFSSPYFLRTTSVLRHGLTLREDGQQGIVMDSTERMRRMMPISVQQECWVNASQLTEPAVVHELAEHPPTSVVWDQPLHGIIAANCARLQLLYHHREEGNDLSHTRHKEDKDQEGQMKRSEERQAVARKEPFHDNIEKQEISSMTSAKTVKNKWVVAQAIPIIPRWRLRDGAVGVPFLNYDDASPAAPTHHEYPLIWYNLGDVLGVTEDDHAKLDRYLPVDETSLPVSSALKVFCTLRALQAGFHSPVWVQLQDPWKEKYIPLRPHVRKPARRGPSNVFAFILPSDSNLVIYRGEVYMNYEEYSLQILGQSKKRRRYERK